MFGGLAYIAAAVNSHSMVTIHMGTSQSHVLVLAWQCLVHESGMLPKHCVVSSRFQPNCVRQQDAAPLASMSPFQNMKVQDFCNACREHSWTPAPFHQPDQIP